MHAELPQPETTFKLSRHAAAQFAEKWAAVTNEKSSAQSYWRDFYHNVLNISDLQEAGVEFEYRVRSHINGQMRWIDCFHPGVVLIEHKSAGKDLDRAEEQAREYLQSLKAELRPPVIILSDFARWRIVDVLAGKSVEFPVQDLPKHLDRIEHIFSNQTVDVAAVQLEVDRKATSLMTDLYKELARNGYDGHAANVLLGRLLFLMYGDDTGMFPTHGEGLFHSYIQDSAEDGFDVGMKLGYLFQVLDQPKPARPSNLPEVLTKFPYVGGELFTEQIPIPVFDERMRTALLAACGYAWSEVNPILAGTMFEQVKSKEDRHADGQHYTPEKFIMRLIRPLFLDELEERMWTAWDDKKQLEKLRRELGELRIVDPACGSANILMTSFRELRDLEIQIIARIKQLDGTYGQLQILGDLDLMVRPENFTGIELDEWPATLARVGMLLVDHRTKQDLDTITGVSLPQFPITEHANIVQANALEIDWEELVPKNDHVIFVGNPPFMGSSNQSAEQKNDQRRLWVEEHGKAIRGGGSIDFVANWFLKAARYMSDTNARAAFISTNSITQGEQPAILWGQLYQLGMHIDFAHRSFKWQNGGTAKTEAGVHVVIIGFSARAKPSKRPLWDYPDVKAEPKKLEADRINAYLVDGAEVLVEARRVPCSALAPIMRSGNIPRDGGFISDISEGEAEQIRRDDPVAAIYLRRVYGAAELLQGKVRYCLWLEDVEPTDLRRSPVLRERLGLVRDARLGKPGKKGATADTPALFADLHQPSGRYLMVPSVSSERRQYVPAAFMSGSDITTNAVFSIETASGFDVFGLLQSRAFTIWVSAVSSRLKSDYQISAGSVYNTFPWPALDDSTKASLESVAQGVLDARAAHPASSLADLYDPLAMPADLRAAHKALDKVVLQAYGLPASASDAEILEMLFARYVELTSEA